MSRLHGPGKASDQLPVLLRCSQGARKEPCNSSKRFDSKTLILAIAETRQDINHSPP
jgi:hypothetical protein